MFRSLQREGKGGVRSLAQFHMVELSNMIWSSDANAPVTGAIKSCIQTGHDDSEIGVGFGSFSRLGVET